MNILAIIASLVSGFFLLVKGADLFVGAASGLAQKLGVPSFVVGLTIVALGTSAPEAAISIVSSLQAANGMAIANVLGSNIVNTLVILGLTAFVARIPVRRSTTNVEFPLVLAANLFLLAMCLNDGVLGRVDGLLLIGMLIGYLCLIMRNMRVVGDAQQPESQGPQNHLALRMLFGATGIFVGARLAVGGAQDLGALMGISERVLGLTVIALGTSLPELVTSLTAAGKGHTDVALGNVVGSSILNTLFVLGTAGIINPMPFGNELLFDAGVVIFATTLVWLLSRLRHGLGRSAGFALLGCYATYLAIVLVRA